jgi:hypothetical protein
MCQFYSDSSRFFLQPTVPQSIPFKNAVDVASNGERFTLANAANLKTYYWNHGISGRLEI